MLPIQRRCRARGHRAGCRHRRRPRWPSVYRGGAIPTVAPIARPRSIMTLKDPMRGNRTVRSGPSAAAAGPPGPSGRPHRAYCPTGDPGWPFVRCSPDDPHGGCPEPSPCITDRSLGKRIPGLERFGKVAGQDMAVRGNGSPRSCATRRRLKRQAIGMEWRAATGRL